MKNMLLCTSRLVIVLGTFSAVLLGGIGICEAQSTGSVPVTGSDAGQKSPYELLIGTWQRADGGYVLEIKSVDNNGAMNAAYFNPHSIHVAKAEASHTGGATTIFVELRDTNYPGSKYNLTYYATDDRLAGTYYQAVEGQTYNVYFERMKP